MRKTIYSGLIALAVFFPTLAPAADIHTQQYTTAAVAPRIDGFDVEPVTRPAAGNELVFMLYGSPGGSAAVRIDGATGGVDLTENEAGVYEGSYTIRRRDKITTKSTATANLRLGNRVVSAILDEPLVGIARAKRPPPPLHSNGIPKIDRFEVDPPARLEAGEELILILSGSPGGAASARIAGVKGKLVLGENQPGEYSGVYTIKHRDRIAADATVTGNLRIGGQETNAVLGRSLLAPPGHASNRRPGSGVCANCGVVEAINVVEVKGEGSYLGKIAGGVAGAILGNQIGSGSGRTVARVAGAAGGIYAGNEIEKRMKTVKHHEVLVRLDNGGAQTFAYENQPDFGVGTRVKVENATLVVVR